MYLIVHGVPEAKQKNVPGCLPIGMMLLPLMGTNHFPSSPDTRTHLSERDPFSTLGVKFESKEVKSGRWAFSFLRLYSKASPFTCFDGNYKGSTELWIADKSSK